MTTLHLATRTKITMLPKTKTQLQTELRPTQNELQELRQAMEVLRQQQQAQQTQPRSNRNRAQQPDHHQPNPEESNTAPPPAANLEHNTSAANVHIAPTAKSSTVIKMTQPKEFSYEPTTQPTMPTNGRRFNKWLASSGLDRETDLRKISILTTTAGEAVEELCEIHASHLKVNLSRGQKGGYSRCSARPAHKLNTAHRLCSFGTSHNDPIAQPVQRPEAS